MDKDDSSVCEPLTNESLLLGFNTPNCKKLASKVTESKFKTEVKEKVQNNNVELESFTDVDIDERTEPEVTESRFKIKLK